MVTISNTSFWNDGRRKYVASILANLALVFAGSTLTSELFKVGLLIQVTLLTFAIGFILLGIFVHPKKGE